MKYKFFVYCPDDKQVIKEIIEAASVCGAGVYGNYSHVAFVTHGEGSWESEKGARPVQGVIGEVTEAPVAKIEMICSAEKAKQVEKLIKKVHPWEQVDIEFVEIEEM